MLFPNDFCVFFIYCNQLTENEIYANEIKCLFPRDDEALPPVAGMKRAFPVCLRIEF